MGSLIHDTLLESFGVLPPSKRGRVCMMPLFDRDFSAKGEVVADVPCLCGGAALGRRLIDVCSVHEHTPIFLIVIFAALSSVQSVSCVLILSFHFPLLAPAEAGAFVVFPAY